jgi:hypothetical protein
LGAAPAAPRVCRSGTKCWRNMCKSLGTCRSWEIIVIQRDQLASGWQMPPGCFASQGRAPSIPAHAMHARQPNVAWPTSFSILKIGALWPPATNSSRALCSVHKGRRTRGKTRHVVAVRMSLVSFFRQASPDRGVYSSESCPQWLSTPAAASALMPWGLHARHSTASTRRPPVSQGRVAQLHGDAVGSGQDGVEGSHDFEVAGLAEDGGVFHIRHVVAPVDSVGPLCRQPTSQLASGKGGRDPTDGIRQPNCPATAGWRSVVE